MAGCDHTGHHLGKRDTKHQFLRRLTLTLRALHGLQDNCGRFDFSRGGRVGWTGGRGWGERSSGSKVVVMPSMASYDEMKKNERQGWNNDPLNRSRLMKHTGM